MLVVNAVGIAYVPRTTVRYGDLGDATCRRKYLIKIGRCLIQFRRDILVRNAQFGRVADVAIKPTLRFIDAIKLRAFHRVPRDLDDRPSLVQVRDHAHRRRGFALECLVRVECRHLVVPGVLVLVLVLFRGRGALCLDARWRLQLR